MVSGMKLVKVTKINQVTEEPLVITSYNDLTDKPDLSDLHAPHSDDQTLPANSDFTLNGLSEKSYNNLTDRPTIPTALSDFSEDSTHRLVTDTEKSTWDGKADSTHIHSGTLIFTYFT